MDSAETLSRTLPRRGPWRTTQNPASAATGGVRGMSFARTKIQPPRPRAGTTGTWIERPALDAHLLDALLGQRLVLVCAAAGYGKTTALARQLARLPAGTAVAWVSADADDDLHRLLECWVAALEPYDLPWRTAPEALLARVDDPRGRARLAAELLDALESCEVEHGVIVFDDLHRVADAAFFELLDGVLERLGPRWTVAIATREDPPLSLARWRAAGELAEFRRHELQFAAEEAEALAGALEAEVPGAGALAARTRGWPAGLRLALAHGARSAAAGERAIRDFLAEEVVAPLPEDLRAFLLRSAVLPELTAARAAAVTGDARAAAQIERIERLGLFVSSLQAAEPTLRLHDLFRETLLERLRLEHPDEWPALWRRAAAGESDPARQLPMLLHAGDVDGAAAALLAQAPTLLTEGALGTVGHLLALFPENFAAASPALHEVRGLLAWARWDFPAMLQSMRAAERGWLERGEADRARAAVAHQSLALNALGRHVESAARLGPLRREAMSRDTRVVVLVACTWHALDLGSLHRLGPLLDELVALLETCDDASLWYRAHPLPRLNGLPGTEASLQRYVRGALRVAADRPLPLRALARVQAGWHHAWQRGDLDAAETELAAVLEDCRWLGEPANVAGSAQLLAAFVHALRGEREPALAAAERMVDEHPTARGPASLWVQRLHAARVAARFDDRERLVRHLDWLQGHPSADGFAAAAQASQIEALAGHAERLAGRREAAVDCWSRALECEEAIDRLGHAVEVRLYRAAALLALGRRESAAAELATAVRRVAGGAGVGAALFARPAIEALAAADWTGVLSDEAISVLGGWLGRAFAPPAAEAAALPGGLSAREWGVLERIAAGDSNKLIARALDLSPHTVKRHVANILDKLGAASRGQAAAWYAVQRG